MKSLANQVRRSGWVGQLPCEPKSPGVDTSGRPKMVCQYRFTVTLAVSGWSLSINHLANPSRFLGNSFSMGGRKAGVLG